MAARWRRSATTSDGNLLRPTRWEGMTEEELRIFAARNGLTVNQARRVIDEHGDDQSAWDEAARNLIHFLKSPS